MLPLRSAVKLVTFDATNTLIKVKKSVGHRYYQVAEIYGLVRQSERDKLIAKFNENFQICMREMKEKHPMYGVNEGISNSQWWLEVTREVLKRSGLADDKRVDVVVGHLYKMFSTGQPYEYVNGAMNFLRTLKSEHPELKLGIVSNSDERLVQIIAELRLRHFFNFVILPQLDKVQKPDPAVFKLALEKASLHEPSEAVHIGDSVKKDYFAAKKCKWNALLLSPVKENLDDGVDQADVVNDLKSILSHPLFRNAEPI